MNKMWPTVFGTMICSVIVGIAFTCFVYEYADAHDSSYGIALCLAGVAALVGLLFLFLLASYLARATAAEAYHQQEIMALRVKLQNVGGNIAAINKQLDVQLEAWHVAGMTASEDSEERKRYLANTMLWTKEAIMTLRLLLDNVKDDALYSASCGQERKPSDYGTKPPSRPEPFMHVLRKWPKAQVAGAGAGAEVVKA